jgi:multidrug efflux pump subunit AcrA (membrane-fusion protein)
VFPASTFGPGLIDTGRMALPLAAAAHGRERESDFPTMFPPRVLLCGLAVSCWLTAVPSTALAQPAGPVDDEALQVVIERTPFSIRPAASYDIPLKLQPAREIDVVALVEGVVLPIRVKTGERVAAQTELLRLDGRLPQLELDRAAAALQAAQQEQEKGGAPARVDVARKEVDIAQARLDQTMVRMPWEGVVYRVHVAEGQFVRAGDPLVTIADPSRVYVDVPIDRAGTKVGDSVELKVEDATVSGKVTAILPLSERLDPLRGLFQSVACGRVELDNSDGRFLPGQTVYSPMIPRQPVGEVPTAVITNTDDGARKVQVIRDGVIRDVVVQLLGQVGEEFVWVSGRFANDDQLILRTSEPLPDGTLVAPKGSRGAPAPSTNERPVATPPRRDNF